LLGIISAERDAEVRDHLPLVAGSSAMVLAGHLRLLLSVATIEGFA
jgi:hypothetical protein